MTAPKRILRALGVDAETLIRWRGRGLLRARELDSDQLRPGCENAAAMGGGAAQPSAVPHAGSGLVCWGELRAGAAERFQIWEEPTPLFGEPAGVGRVVVRTAPVLVAVCS